MEAVGQLTVVIAFNNLLAGALAAALEMLKIRIAQNRLEAAPLHRGRGAVKRAAALASGCWPYSPPTLTPTPIDVTASLPTWPT